MKVHFSSESTEWSTPQPFYDELNKEFNFTLDVCATEKNAKCAAYYTKKDDALTKTWSGTCFMNPPYGDPEYPCKPKCKKKICEKRGHHNDVYRPGIGDFVKKAHDSAKYDGATVVCLLPARTDTAWFQDYCLGAEVRFLRGRLKFGSAENSAPFPSVVVIFRSKK